MLAVAGGRVWGWGSNQVGQLGLGSCTPWQATPADVTAALDGAWKVRRASHLEASQPATTQCMSIHAEQAPPSSASSRVFFYQCQVLVEKDPTTSKRQ